MAAEEVMIHFEDQDAIGVVHSGRYVKGSNGRSRPTGAESRRVEVRPDAAALRPAPIAPVLRTACRSLVRPVSPPARSNRATS
jgi:hypothetical protein